MVADCDWTMCLQPEFKALLTFLQQAFAYIHRYAHPASGCNCASCRCQLNCFDVQDNVSVSAEVTARNFWATPGDLLQEMVFVIESLVDAPRSCCLPWSWERPFYFSLLIAQIKVIPTPVFPAPYIKLPGCHSALVRGATARTHTRTYLRYLKTIEPKN